MISMQLNLVLVLVCAVPATDRPDPMAARIDRHIAAAWDKAGLTPAAACDDATFLRRVSLDLIGRTPTATEARAFLADRSPEKRTGLVDNLVASPAYARHMARVWRRVWLPQSDAPAFARLAPDFEDWVAVRLAARAPYDQMIRELLTVPPGSADGGGIVVTPRGFRTANEYKPENLAASLGPRIPRPEPGLRTVPRPPLREVDSRPVLGDGRVLCPPAHRAGRWAARDCRGRDEEDRRPPLAELCPA